MSKRLSSTDAIEGGWTMSTARAAAAVEGRINDNDTHGFVPAAQWTVIGAIAACSPPDVFECVTDASLGADVDSQQASAAC